MAAAANGTPTTMMTVATGSPCGACKFLRRKCGSECVFAPYFSSEQGPARFAAIHKVFGASNVSKLLMRVPVSDRCETVVTILYEAQARLRDPVYGCVAHVFALQQQVAYLEAHLIQLKAHLAAQSLTLENHDHDHHQFLQVDDKDHTMMSGIQSLPSNCSSSCNYPLIKAHSLSSHSLTTWDSFESVDHHQLMESCRSDGRHEFSRKRPASQAADLGDELQAIAVRMMRNNN